MTAISPDRLGRHRPGITLRQHGNRVGQNDGQQGWNGVDYNSARSDEVLLY
ncbi:MAG TPA: hypothetical protein VEP67_10525 [Thiobacillaceae bacterium]|nr:hypothetical protein [Thiobacillaceae bacterium]